MTDPRIPRVRCPACGWPVNVETIRLVNSVLDRMPCCGGMLLGPAREAFVRDVEAARRKAVA